MTQAQKTLYLFPYFMTKHLVSFAFSNNKNKIKHVDKCSIKKLQELIERYDRVVTIDFRKLFSLCNKPIYDIHNIKSLYKVSFTKIHEKYKKRKVVSQFNRANVRVAFKLASFKHGNKELVNNTHFQITPIQLMLPKYMLDDIVEANIKYMKLIDNKFIKKNNIEYYTGIFQNYVKVYDNLGKAAVNKLFVMATLQRNNADSVPKQIASVTNQLKDNLIPQPTYNLFSSKTGRPYIISGVNYQQLPITHANVVKSRWNEGKIYEFDFNGCEIRSSLYAIKNYKLANIDEDIYDHFINIMKNVNVTALSRTKAKKFIIMMLFGAAPTTLSKLIKINLSDTNAFIKALEREFKTNEIYRMILKPMKKNGYFYNLFGRPIYVDKETRKETLIQNFIQSTAIDICHSGYAAFIDYAKKEKLLSKAIYTKHDAIRIDFHPNELQHIDEVARIIGKTNIENINFKINVKEQQ